MRKNNLDEMQEQELLKIEHNGCWLAFWLLLVAMIVQSILFDGVQLRTLAGEWCVFMILSLYLAFACVRKGIWDRKIPMNTKTNCLVALLASVIVGIFNAVILFKNYQQPLGSVSGAVFTAFITFILCFVGLTIVMKLTKKRKAELEAEPADIDE